LGKLNRKRKENNMADLGSTVRRMKAKKWHVFFVICIYFAVCSAPALAADCQALKKGFKAELNLKKRRKLVADAVVQCPNDPMINYKYALSLERFRKYEKALGHYQKAVLYDPGMGKAYAGMGDVYIYLGLLDEAIDSYSKAVKNMPENTRFTSRQSCLVVKRKALRGQVLSVADFINVMDRRGKISSNASLLLTGPALQYKIAFVENSDSLQPTGIRQLGAVGQAMQNDALSSIRFEISTHVGSGFSSSAALENSKVRAMMIKDQLVTNFQIDPKRLEVVWYGDAHPLSVDTASGRIDASDRVEFKKIIE
jgi:tetratricopeptide (TPR) repeat protein